MSTAFARRECLTECPCGKSGLEKAPTRHVKSHQCFGGSCEAGICCRQSENFALALPLATGLLAQIFQRRCYGWTRLVSGRASHAGSAILSFSGFRMG